MEISRTKQNLYCPTIKSPYSSILPGPPHLPHRVHILYSFLLLLVFDGNYLLFCYRNAFTYFLLLSFTFCVSIFLLELVMIKKKMEKKFKKSTFVLTSCPRYLFSSWNFLICSDLAKTCFDAASLSSVEL